MHQRNLLSVLNCSPHNAAYHDAANIGIIVQSVGQHLQRLIHFHIRRGNGIQNDLE